MPALNESQITAIRAEGNVLVMAGAGTGKTRTLVERCLARLLDPRTPTPIDRFLIVTFTEAAAAEMRRRLRERLEAIRAKAGDRPWLATQSALLDTAEIGTLHGFCARLVREHFHQLGLDPDLAVLDEGQTAVLRHEVFEALFEQRYGDDGPDGRAFRRLVRSLGRDNDDTIRDLALRLHAHARSLPEPDAWLAGQLANWEAPTPAAWRQRLPEAFERWRREWRSEVERRAPEDPRLAGLTGRFTSPPPLTSLPEACDLLRQIAVAREQRFGRKRKFPPSVEPLAEEANRFLAGLGEGPEGTALDEDYALVRPVMTALLKLVRDFADRFATAKREAAALDFADLEQFALRLLWDSAVPGPTPLARRLRERFAHVLVDEYQDINAAQDRLITALSREDDDASRFLVGDLKQSIYGFRLANPRLFRAYAEQWRAPGRGAVVTLQDNFRSRPAILDFANDVFAALMRPEVGGVSFDDTARLRAGDPNRVWPPDTTPVQLLLCDDDTSVGGTSADGEAGGPDAPSPLERTTLEREAAAVADQLQAWHDQKLPVTNDEGGDRPVRWSDMVVLLRSLKSQAETYAKVFEQKGVPLVAARGGLYAALESRDLLNLLRVLDNPLQDLPLLAVLRSPFGGLDVNELALIRLAHPRGLFWSALRAFASDARPAPAESGGSPPSADAPDADTPPALPALRASAAGKVTDLLDRLAGWRELARQAPLSDCLDQILAETHYEEWLLAQPRGEQRRANVRRFVALARQFDPWQRQGLPRFLRFVEARLEAEADPPPGVVEATGPVRLLSIHQSKGLEFPVVVLAGLGRSFNEQDLRRPVLLDETFGLCPRVDPPDLPRSYPSLPLLLAKREHAAQLRGEELRLLYVALTRAAEKLLLVGSFNLEKAGKQWSDPPPTPWPERRLRAARRPLDWLGPLLGSWTGDPDWLAKDRGACARFAWRLVPAGAASADAPDAATRETGPPPPDAETLLARLAETRFTYPHEAATRETAKTAVTALRKRALEDDPTEEARPLFRAPGETPFPALRLEPDGRLLSAAERGTAHHRFLQFADFDQLGSVDEITAQAKQLVAAGRLAPEEAGALDPAALAAFGRGPLAGRLREPGADVRRELPFTLRLTPADAALLALPVEPGLAADEGIVVQGVIDVAVFTGNGIWILDFKTDAVTAASLPEKVRAYTPQLNLYALALTRIHRRPVTEAWLHFLALNRSASVPPAALCP